MDSLGGWERGVRLSGEGASPSLRPLRFCHCARGTQFRSTVTLCQSGKSFVGVPLESRAMSVFILCKYSRFSQQSCFPSFLSIYERCLFGQRCLSGIRHILPLLWAPGPSLFLARHILGFLLILMSALVQREKPILNSLTCRS